MKKRGRVLVVLGEGGHTVEMVRLVKLLGPRYEYAYLVVREDPLSEKKIPIPGPVYRVNRALGKEPVPTWLAVLRYLRLTVQSARVLRQARPQAILQSGPGVAVPISVLAKMMGIPVIYVENGARVRHSSRTGRIMYRFADLFFVQWPPLQEREFPRATYAGMLHGLDAPAPASGQPRDIIFVTVGSGDFDPLVRAMDEIAPHLDLPVVMQIGVGTYEPRNAEWFRLAPSLEPYYQRAAVVVAHGGVGVTMEVLSRGIPLVGVDNPDRYDQHQQDLLGYLSEQGHLIWCHDLGQLASCIQQARTEPLKPIEPPYTAIHRVVDDVLQALARGEDVRALFRRYRGARVLPDGSVTSS